jgi:dephospho-CoA kinase
MLKIGVTGNIGAGKTQVCQIFELLDIPVYYADPRAKSLMVEDKLLVHAIKSLLGEQAYQEDGQLDRKYISNLVFRDRAKLNLLNGLVHPAVARDFEKWTSMQRAPYCIKEAALLFEAGSYKQLDKTVLVVADEEIRLRRVLARDGLPEEQVRARMANQMSQEEKIKLADYILHNNGDQGLVKQVLALHPRLLGL